ncbi:MFS transporter [Saccharomonospora piscinae]|uniref:MFS transporter n=1 Tax=Saccharomonospora piscinae TaxID=687388 RepID=UPI000467AA9C|nr:MFS transporter [Saccharomonospora piscinae]
MTTTQSAAEPVRTRWAAVAAVALGVVLASLDLTVVAVALPTLGADLGASPSLTQWVLLAYSLPMVAVSIPAGRWLDRAGPRASFGLATAGFGVTSVLVAVAPTVEMLLVARALQGVFAALVSVVSMPVVSESVRPEHRARAMSIVLTLIPLSGAAGPAVGGALTDALGWRSVFAINVPIVVAAFWLGARAIPSTAAGRTGLPRPNAAMLRETALLGTAVTALFLGLDLLAEGPVGWATVALPVVAFGLGWLWLRTREAAGVRELWPRLAAPLTALPLVTTGIAGLNFVVPYFLVDAHGASPATVGLALLIPSVGMAVASPIAGVVADRTGTVGVSTAGVVVVLGGFVAAALYADGEFWQLAVSLAAVGVGNGLFAGPNAAEVLARTPPELRGTSSGMTSVARTLGFSLGPALGALVWTSVAGATVALAAVMTTLGVVTVLALAACGWTWRGAPSRKH